MKSYTVVFHPDAEVDIASAYKWGCRVWGEARAKTWVRELRHNIESRLTSAPLACPLAPESEDLGLSIRQLIIRRYRVLFIVEKRTATIIHVSGAYARQLASTEAGDE